MSGDHEQNMWLLSDTVNPAIMERGAEVGRSVSGTIWLRETIRRKYLQIASTMTISRVDLNVSIAFHWRHFTLTRGIKQAYLDEGIDIDQRRKIVTEKEYVDWISLSHAYNYVVRVIKTCSPGFLNCVLSMSTFRAKTDKKHHKQGQQLRERYHIESDDTSMRLDHTASFQTGSAL